MVQRQQRHRGAQADPRGALRGRAQHHQRVGEHGEPAREVELAEPGGVEAEGVAQLDLGQDVRVALALGEAGRARELVEEPEAHVALLGGPLGTAEGRVYQGAAPSAAALIGISTKLDNHKAPVALYFMWYNFARIHQAA
jgi:hypothetical protein